MRPGQIAGTTLPIAHGRPADDIDRLGRVSGVAALCQIESRGAVDPEELDDVMAAHDCGCRNPPSDAAQPAQPGRLAFFTLRIEFCYQISIVDWRLIQARKKIDVRGQRGLCRGASAHLCAEIYNRRTYAKQAKNCSAC